MPTPQPLKPSRKAWIPCLAIGLIGLILPGLSAPDQPITDHPDTAPANQTSLDTNQENTIKECVVVFATGRTLTGILMDSNDQSIVLRINGIDTTYRRARIASVKFLPPIETRFKVMRDATPDSDIDARLMLVDWLRDRRAYQLAIQELDSILEAEPYHSQAKILKTWLEQHLKLAQSKKLRSKTNQQTIPSTKDTIPLLSQEQINLIRVFEIDLSNPPKILVDDSVIQDLMRRSPDSFPVNERDRQAMLDGSDLDKLKILFRNKARDLYANVQVLEDPESFTDFKQNIAGRTAWLTNGCATARCHGGDQAGDFQLVSRKPNSAQALYTNFVILDQFTLKDGSPLINHTDPDRSPLIQMGLVRSKSLYPHPDVDPSQYGRDWRAVFRSTKATNFKRSASWIRSLYTPRPDYGFTHPPTAPQPSPSPESGTNP